MNQANFLFDYNHHYSLGCNQVKNIVYQQNWMLVFRLLSRDKGTRPVLWKHYNTKLDQLLRPQTVQILFIFQILSNYVRILWIPNSNQVTVVAFQLVQLTQASFLQKNQTWQNGFLISVKLRWHRASVVCKNQSF